MVEPTRITDKLFFGAGHVCRPWTDNTYAVVHACKDPCHRNSIGYTGKSLDKTHPYYLAYERPHHLYMNLIDPPYPMFMAESFVRFFEFADREIQERPLLIHCNQGESRAPSLTLLYMAKRLNLLPNDSYDAARAAFEMTQTYRPGKGIEGYLRANWNGLG